MTAGCCHWECFDLHDSPVAGRDVCVFRDGVRRNREKRETTALLMEGPFCIELESGPSCVEKCSLYQMGYLPTLKEVFVVFF